MRPLSPHRWHPWLGLCLLMGCKTESLNCGLSCSDERALLFNFGFEGVQLVQDGTLAHIEGTDSAYETHNRWEDWQEGEQGSLTINYEDGELDQRIAELVEDPVDSENQVLRFQITSPNVYQGRTALEARIQMELNDTQCLTEFHQSLRMYFPSDTIDALSQYPDSIQEFSFFEAWNNASWSGEKNPFRVVLGLRKERGPGEAVVFDALGQRVGLFGEYKDSWISTSGYPVPKDVWMDVDIYVREGDAETGRVLMAIHPEGGERDLIYDITGRTYHPDEDCVDGFTHVRPLQMVSAAEVADFVAEQGQRLEIYWDDWVLTQNWDGESD